MYGRRMGFSFQRKKREGELCTTEGGNGRGAWKASLAVSAGVVEGSNLVAVGGDGEPDKDVGMGPLRCSARHVLKGGGIADESRPV